MSHLVKVPAGTGTLVRHVGSIEAAAGVTVHNWWVLLWHEGRLWSSGVQTVTAEPPSHATLFRYFEACFPKSAAWTEVVWTA